MQPQQTSRAIVLLLLVLACAPFHYGREDAIILPEGEAIYGTLAGKEAGFILLRLPSDDGEIIRRFDARRISRIEFSDTDSIDPAPLDPDVPIEQVEALAARRAPYLENLQAKDEAILIALAQRLAQADRALEALAYLKLWSPKLSDLDNRERASELLIEASLTAKLDSEALVHAQNWLASHPYPSDSDNVVAWGVVARSELALHRPERALWISLQPIADARAEAPRGLDACYQVAIDAAQEMGLDAYAAMLANEQAGEPPPPKSADDSSAPMPIPSLSAPSLAFEQALKSHLHLTR